MSNWKCPPRKRQIVSYVPEQHASLHTVLVEGANLSGSYKYFSPHETFEWLYQNIDRPWHCVSGEPFKFAVQEQYSWRHATFQFEEIDDAVLFQLRFNGKLLGADFEQRRQSEKQVQSILAHVCRLPRNERLSRFAGLDELIVAAAQNSC